MPDATPADAPQTAAPPAAKPATPAARLSALLDPKGAPAPVAAAPAQAPAEPAKPAEGADDQEDRNEKDPSKLFAAAGRRNKESKERLAKAKAAEETARQNAAALQTELADGKKARELIKLFETDPEAALEQLGASYDAITERRLYGQSPQGAKQLAIEKELRELKAREEGAKKEAADRQAAEAEAANHTEATRMFLASAERLRSELPDLAVYLDEPENLTAAAENMAYKLGNAGKLSDDPEEALAQVARELNKDLARYHAKVRAGWTKAEAAAAVVTESAKPAEKPAKASPKTLSNAHAAAAGGGVKRPEPAKPMNTKERQAALLARLSRSLPSFHGALAPVAASLRHPSSRANAAPPRAAPPDRDPRAFGSPSS